MNTYFNRVDADPTDAAASGTQLNSLMSSLGGQLGTNCSNLGAAMSTMLQYLSSQAASRNPLTGVLINGMISGFCKAIPSSITLTPQGQAACAVTGNTGNTGSTGSTGNTP